MKLVNDIINELVDSEKSISSPLLKTKVLASRLQNKNLLKWVTNELRGYDDSCELPEYRRFNANIVGTFINGNTRYNNQPVPILGLDKEVQARLTDMSFCDSVSSMEKLKQNKENVLVEYVFPAEVTGLIEDNWRGMGNPYLQLVNCKRRVSISVIEEILASVRNNLLDFMLMIDAEFGNVTEIEELKTKKEEIATIMNQTIINNNGDGNVLNTGENVNISADINIVKGSKDDLLRCLEKAGIAKDDLDELDEVIDIDEPNFNNKTFGIKVNEWTQKMLGKALDGSWNVGVGAAGNLIAEAIKAYYGM